MTLTLVVVRPASSRGGAVFGEHFEYMIRAANTAGGYVVYDVILVRQRCFAHVLRPGLDPTNNACERVMGSVVK